MLGALAGGVAGGIGGIEGISNPIRASLHGITQGAISKAGGGRFGDGALGAFASSLGGNAIARAGPGVRQAMVAAAVGGTASVIGGGKFANGAVSAAFVAAFSPRAEARSNYRESVDGAADTEASRTPQEHVAEARQIVDGLIADGHISPPVRDYVVLSVKYVDAQPVTEDGLLITGSNIGWKNDPINRGRIEIYRAGAVTLDKAIVTYGHELGHFNRSWGEVQAEAYGQRALRVYHERQALRKNGP